MTLIKSISGIRGTIGGKAGNTLSPIDTVKFAGAYGTWLLNRHDKKATVVLGRDARLSGKMVSNLVASTLQALGINVIDVGLSTTPTVEMMVTKLDANGGIILTASHNPIEWNALKLLNNKGEFLNAAEGAEVLRIAESDEMTFAGVLELGSYTTNNDAIAAHIAAILALPVVDVARIKQANFKVAIDAVNSTGGIAIPALLKALGVAQVEKLYCEPTGHFPHNPEPLKEHLGDIMKTVVDKQCDIGLVVDPDVDRLALIAEDGSMFGEEYTLVAVTDYLFRQNPGHVVSNLSSSRALRDVAERLGGSYSSSAVGEVNVVAEMKATGATIGGEGNGGVILPELHYGRDALVGIALILTHLAKTGLSVSALRKTYPDYFMAKKKISLKPTMDVDGILKRAQEKYARHKLLTIDGVKIEFDNSWVHLRKSNTEPIIRVYTEAPTQEHANALGNRFVTELMQMAE
jgi:phosphomannomutase